VSTVRVGGIRFHLYPQDHEPRHVHGIVSRGQVIVNLRADGSVALAQRSDAVIGVTTSEVRKVLQAAAEHFDELVRVWERMHP
jgi:hypothetical protein